MLNRSSVKNNASFEGQNQRKSLVEKAFKAAIEQIQESFQTHKSSGDHDDRYCTKSDLNAVIENAIKNTLLKAYPVGSIYISARNTNPSGLFGGTWTAWGAGRVPVGVNTSDSNFNAVEKTGGSSTHTHTNPTTAAASGNTGATALTVNQIPAHAHNENLRVQYPSGSEASANHMFVCNGYWNWRDGCSGTGRRSSTGTMAVNTSNAGGGQSHTHTLNSHTHTQGNTGSASSLQPYITCYMWKRTA